MRSVERPLASAVWHAGLWRWHPASTLARPKPAAIAKPRDSTFRSAHEVAPVGLTLRIGREYVVVAIEGYGEFGVAGHAQPAINGPELDRLVCYVIGRATGRDYAGGIAAFILSQSLGRQSLRHGGRIAQSAELAQHPAGRPPQLGEEPGARRRVGQHGHRELPVGHEKEVGDLPGPRSAVLEHRHTFSRAPLPEADAHA